MAHQAVLAFGFGLVTASVIALAAVGITLQFGVMNYINFAYGGYLGLAGLLAWQLNVSAGLTIWVAISISSIGMALVAIVLDWLLLRRFANRSWPQLYMLIVTLGLWLMLSNALVAIWGPNPRQFNAGSGLPSHVGPFLLTKQQIVIFFVAVGALVAVHLLLTRTKLGKAMRAMSDDRVLAGACGIDAKRIVTMTWLVTGFLIGLAGCVLALNLASFDYTFGDSYLFVVFAAVILGGIGQPYGTMVGALIIGLATEMSAVVINSAYKTDVAFALLILMLMIRPQGLIPAPGRR
jgi:branched-subunit amino acid ABC-type transport system permease component